MTALTSPDVSTLLAGGGVFLGLTLVLVLVRRNTRPDRLLAAALAVAVVNILHGLFLPSHSLGSPGLLTEPLQFALPPLFAAYVRALFDPIWRLRPGHLAHFVPSVVVSLLSVALGALLPAPGTAVLAWSTGIWLALLLQAAVYLRAAIGRIRRHRKALRDEVSTLAGVDQGWLLWYSRALHLLYLAYALVPAVLLHAGGAPAARHLVGLALCLAVGTLAGHQLMPRTPPPANLPAPAPPLPTPATWDPDLPGTLNQAMEERSLYRDPGLTLGALAAAVGWPRNEVSAALNGHYRQSFHDYVNGWRVREAQRLLADPKNRSSTLLGLGLDAGFNSKPTFNAVFKKTTGMTPSAWASRHQGV